MDIQTLSHVTDRIATISSLSEDSAEFQRLIDTLYMELSDEIDRQEARMYNELFLQPSGTTFDRNRFYTGLGYKYAPNIQFQLGYLLQTVGDNTGQYLQFGLIFDT